MSDAHPYIRSYAFGALSFRKCDNLFPYIIENLKDTSQILEYTGDAGMNAYPGDLMIEYEVYRLTDTQKKKLNHLITSKYRHLDRALRVLSRL